MCVFGFLCCLVVFLKKHPLVKCLFLSLHLNTLERSLFCIYHVHFILFSDKFPHF